MTINYKRVSLNNQSLVLMRVLLIMLVLISSQEGFSQVLINEKDCIGIWKTIDDETGVTKSRVEIFKKGNSYYGKVLEILDPQALKDSGKSRYEDILCDDCPSERGKDQPIMGLEIIWEMEKGSDKWSGGKIMDPENGKIYTCTMWLSADDTKGNTLHVRGWLAFFFRTQTWYRVK